MLEVDSTPDRWINFVLQNGWRLKASVDEETGELMTSISNENGTVGCDRFQGLNRVVEIVDTYRVYKNEEENR